MADTKDTVLRYNGSQKDIFYVLNRAQIYNLMSYFENDDWDIFSFNTNPAASSGDVFERALARLSVVDVCGLTDAGDILPPLTGVITTTGDDRFKYCVLVVRAVNNKCVFIKYTIAYDCNPK